MSIGSDPFHVPPHLFGAGIQKEVLVMPAPHAHDQVELNFVLRGGMTYAFGRDTVRVAAGDFVFFWGAALHQTIAVDRPTYFVCLYVPIDRFLSLPLGTRLAAAVLAGGVIGANQKSAFDAAQLERLHAELVGPDARLVELDRAELEHMLRRVDLIGWRDLLGRAETGSGRLPGHDKALAMARFILAHAGERVAIADVAAAARLHPNYAMAVFRAAFGTTIGEYLLRQRLGRAKTLLSTTRDHVASVAFAAGFGSLSRFYEAFAREVGTSPRRFRAEAAAR